MTIFVLLGCHDQSPQTRRLGMTEMDSCVVLEARRLKPGCPTKALGDRSLSQLLVASGVLGLWLCYSWSISVFTWPSLCGSNLLHRYFSWDWGVCVCARSPSGILTTAKI